VGLALCAPEVLRVLGPGFVEGAAALRVLSLALLLCFSNTALFHVLIAAGDTAVIPRLTAIRVGVAAILGVLVIPSFGPVAAAMSFTAAEFVLFASLIHRVRGHATILVARPVGLALLACVPMAGLLLGWSLSLPVSIAAGALLFSAAAGAILLRGTEASGLA
jgi:O-antigen/teichoic acid export membrane protein